MLVNYQMYEIPGLPLSDPQLLVMKFKELTLNNEEFWIKYSRNMAVVFWKELYASTLNEEQFKETFLEALEYGLEKVSHPSLCLARD